MNIRNRYNRDGVIIDDPEKYDTPYSEELTEFLDYLYNQGDEISTN